MFSCNPIQCRWYCCSYKNQCLSALLRRKLQEPNGLVDILQLILNCIQTEEEQKMRQSQTCDKAKNNAPDTLLKFLGIQE